jgi:hypothetical protein
VAEAVIGDLWLVHDARSHYERTLNGITPLSLNRCLESDSAQQILPSSHFQQFFPPRLLRFHWVYNLGGARSWLLRSPSSLVIDLAISRTRILSQSLSLILGLLSQWVAPSQISYTTCAREPGDVSTAGGLWSVRGKLGQGERGLVKCATRKTLIVYTPARQRKSPQYLTLG